MKKALLLFSVILFFGNAFSQVKLGLNFNPGLLINRIQQPSNDTSFAYSRNGAGFKFTAGPDIHIMFSDNYGMALGLWYKASRAGVTVKDKKTGVETKSVTNLQYVMIPVTLKMYTNEIATDMKLYFQVGAALDIKVASKDKKLGLDPVKKFGLFDSDVLAGAGVEYKVGSNTYLMGGLRYSRSLINNVWKTNPGFQKFKLNADLISLDLGIKF